MIKYKWLVILLFMISSVVLVYLWLQANEDNKVIFMEQSEGSERMENMILKIGDHRYPVILEENETVEAFLALLPLEISMNELHGNEKYYYFNQDLPSNSVSVKKVEAGDIMLFGSDCLVLFYESFSTTYAYTRIGKVTDGELLKERLGTGSIRLTFERQKN